MQSLADLCGNLRARNGSSPWQKKPIWVLENEISTMNHEDEHGIGVTPENDESSQQTKLKRHLTLFDLVSIGVGGTIGSGIFVLSGLIAKEFSGPATFVSWIVAGIAAMLSGCCYAELSGRLPTEGSSYAYVYVAMGELLSVIAAACLTLEYLVSGSAVARSWGNKMVDLFRVNLGEDHWIQKVIDPGFGFNTFALVVSVLSLLSLLQGVKESKSVTNFFATAKVLLVLFMIFGGIPFFKWENLSPFIPPKFGIAGIMRGATSSFFGYIGYDEVCCVAGEAINPQKNMPRAVMLTIAIVTGLTVSASLSLVGMQPYLDISASSGFPIAFRYNDAIIASQICAFGELITLPIVVLISLMAQPRLNFALAKDGLLPPIFGEVDSSGNLFKGTLISGIFMSVVAAFIPFLYLDDLISGGILMAFSMTNSSLVLMRHESPDIYPFLLQQLLIKFNGLSFLTGLCLKYISNTLIGKAITILVFGLTIRTCFQIAKQCPRCLVFGGKLASNNATMFSNENGQFFMTPMVPYLPCMGMFINWYLVAQLEPLGIGLLVFYVGLAGAYYFYHGSRNRFESAIGSKKYKVIGEVEKQQMEDTRELSLPQVD